MGKASCHSLSLPHFQFGMIDWIVDVGVKMVLHRRKSPLKNARKLVVMKVDGEAVCKAESVPPSLSRPFGPCSAGIDMTSCRTSTLLIGIS